jgi:hypothetical protein
MTRKYRQEHDLMNLEAEDLLESSEDLSPRDLEQFLYPHDKEVEAVGVRGIYLNNYIRWDAKAQHELMIKAYGYETAVQQRTFDTYSDVDCFHYSSLHDYLKFLKHGYGKVTDHASREIRLKRLTREEGIDLVGRYASVEPADLPLFLKWIGMKEDEFGEAIDHHRDPRIWARVGERWQFLDSVLQHRSAQGVDDVRLEKQGDCTFLRTPSKAPHASDDHYVLIGRGWVDQDSVRGASAP